jgi:3-isopropylmalate dehydratase
MEKKNTAPVKVKPSAATSASASKASISDPSKQFTNLKGAAAAMKIQNIDTDMIIPKQFLKTIKRSGLGVSAFYELRYDPSTGNERPDFILNKEGYRASSILVAGDNFGCGSSREHAPWALRDFGIRCIISTSFADIFYSNCFKNGMLPIVLPRNLVDELMVDCDNKKQIEIDLASQTIVRSNGDKISFDIDPFKKHCLLNGLDDIGLTMQKSDSISKFEIKRTKESPWLDNAAQKYVEV